MSAWRMHREFTDWAPSSVPRYSALPSAGDSNTELPATKRKGTDESGPTRFFVT